MRKDQIDALNARAEELVDLFLKESDPQKWPGHGLEPHEMEPKDRGDRFWCKKDCAATLACAQRITTLTDILAKPDDGANDDLGKEIAEAQKEAEKLLDQVQKTAKKTAWDKRVHGKG
jgi:hypothetical protein